MLVIGGELGIKIIKIKPDSEAVRPYDGYGHKRMTDLNLFGDDNHWLHICGENDWGYLALEVLKPILQTAIGIHKEITDHINESNPEVILVGRNDFRLLDILHIARDGEEGISIIRGIPVVKGDFDNGVKFLGKKTKDDSELPFK